MMNDTPCRVVSITMQEDGTRRLACSCGQWSVNLRPENEASAAELAVRHLSAIQEALLVDGTGENPQGIREATEDTKEPRGRVFLEVAALLFIAAFVLGAFGAMLLLAWLVIPT